MKPQDVPKLEKQILRLATERALRHKLARQANRDVQRFDWTPASVAIERAPLSKISGTSARRHMYSQAHQRSSLRVDDVRSLSAPLPLVLTLLSLTCLFPPEETSLFVASLRLPLSRILLLIAFPFALYRLGRQFLLNRYCFIWSDVLIFAATVWMVLAVWVTQGPDNALVKGGSTALDFSGAYLAARAFLSRHGQALALAALLASVIAIAGIVSLLDTMLGSNVTHDIFANISGFNTVPPQERRYGIFRAEGPFEHPILLGTGCAIAILLGTSLSGTKRWFTIGGASVGLLACISSGPLSATLIGLACLVYSRITLAFKARWIWLKLAAGVPLLLLLTIHPAPFGWILGHLSFETGSAYYRLIIWNVAGDLVLNSPIFGVGITDWARPDWMPATVDSVWLRSAMSFGIPGSLLIAGCLVGACSRQVDIRPTRLTPAERQLGVTLSIIMFIFIFTGFTVHFWGITWMLMGLLAGMRAHLGALAYQTKN